MITYIVSLLILLPISALALYRTWHLARAINHLSLLSDDVVGGCEAIGFTGFSVVCYNLPDIEHISTLLGQEYQRYEVIVVVDSTTQHAMLHEIIARYKLIRVNGTSTLELSSPIGHLYRSRQRGFRRLIVVDTPHRSTYEDINAGVIVASYDHILPLRDKTTLYPKAIEHLAIMLCDERVRRSAYIISRSDRAVLFRRDAIIHCGGFTPYIQQKIGKGKKTYMPIIYERMGKRDIFSPHTTIFSLLIAFLIMKSATENMITIAPIMLIICSLSITAICRTELLSIGSSSIWDILYHFRQMLSIFPLRKFIF